MNKYPETPELNRRSLILEKSQMCGEFLDFLMETHGFKTRKYFSHEKLLAEFFNIDLNKIEEERVAVLDYLHEEREAEKLATKKDNK